MNTTCEHCGESEEFYSDGECKLCGEMSISYRIAQAEARQEHEELRGDWLHDCQKDREMEERWAG